MWIEHKTTPWRRDTRSTPEPSPSVSQGADWHADFNNWRKRIFLLRARMLAFVQQILAFATFEVLEPNWRKLEGRLEAGKVETVDQLLRDHVDFLDTCLKECMLTSSKLIKVCIPEYDDKHQLTHMLIGALETDGDMFHVCVVYVGSDKTCCASLPFCRR